MWHLNTATGELARGRCKSTNLCDYCARLAAVENSEMLALAALEGIAVPEVWCVLTTPRTSLAQRDYYRALERFIAAVRVEWPGSEYASLLEMTTGYGPRSGGQRRPHWNLLLVGVPVLGCDRLAEIVAREWCPRVDARPEAQWVAAVSEVGGLMRYVSLHFQKASQAPPNGWRGQRFNCSRRYFGDVTRREMRERARLSLRAKRRLWKALGRAEAIAGGTPSADLVEVVYEQLQALDDASSWRVVGTPARDPQRALAESARQPFALHARLLGRSGEAMA